MQKGILIQDVFSYIKKNGVVKKYSSKGDVVSILSESFPVCIVENEKGLKFPVLKELLKFNQ